MHIKNRTQKLAMAGAMAALSTVLMLLGTYISVNTLFFTAAAAFFAGTAVVIFGNAYGVLFYLLCVLLDFIWNPDKLHVLLYVLLAGYFCTSEISWNLLEKWQKGRKKAWIHRGIRLVVFAVFYVPAVCFLKDSLFLFPVLGNEWYYLSAGVCGGVVWFLLDVAYAVCQKMIGTLPGIKRKEF